MSEGSGKYPRYDFPKLQELIIALLILALIAAVGVAGAGTEVAQNAAHGNSAVYVDSARR